MGGASAGGIRLLAPVARLTIHRLNSRRRRLVVAGVLLGLTFGLSFASFAAGRRTASAYDRVLVAADAEDATVSHRRSPQEAADILDGIDGITGHRYQAGFIGFIDGVDPALTGVLLASVDEGFVVELPRFRGRLPDPDEPGEVFINTYLAERGRLELGQRITLNLIKVSDNEVQAVNATIVGIGTFPREAVADETERFGLVALTRAFHAAHEDFRVYSSSGIHLAPGVDALELAPRLAAVGFEVSETRNQDRHAVGDALQPVLTLVVALGVLLFLGAVVAVSLLLQREQELWRSEDENLAVLGMVRPQIVLVRVATAAVMAMVAIATAAGLLVIASPAAPLGPLHDLDPSQGLWFDGTVALAGSVAVLVAVCGLAGGLASVSGRRGRLEPGKVSSIAKLARRPAAVAGLTLALRATGDRRTWRSVGLATAAVMLTATVATVVVSAVHLTSTPRRYGADWDLIALNPFGDQQLRELRSAFRTDDDVVAATGFTGWTFLVNRRAVPGLAATVVKGRLGPTLLRGDPLRSDDEIVLGEDTFRALGVSIGDAVDVTVAARTDDDGGAETVRCRVVGVVTFPSVVQPGTDQARLGNGALVTRATYDRMTGTDDDDPEWTALRLAPGVEPAALIARHPEGIPDATGLKTSWYTDAKPAELRQLDSVRGLLVGAIAVSYLIVLAVLAHALSTATRANRRDFAVLGAIGFTRRQLGEVATWQVAPLAFSALALGIPIGIAVGRVGFSAFARSLAVVDEAASPASMIGGLVVAVVVAAAIGSLGAMAATRRTRPVDVLRHG